MSEGTENKAIHEIEGLLEAELIRTRHATRRGLQYAIIGGVLIGAYLLWANAQLSKLIDPEGLAEAATGLAIDAVPELGDTLHATVVDGAPDIARAASTSVIDMVPVYRQVLESELAPVVDEVSLVLAQAAVESMVESAEMANQDLAAQFAMQAGADAVVSRLDTVLDEALDHPTELGGPTPRQTIDTSLEKLQLIDRGLKRVAQGKGDPQERELILSWLALMDRYNNEANDAAADAYRSGERVSE